MKKLTFTKYSKIYMNIVNKAISCNRLKTKKTHKDYIYFENHHILPKSIYSEYSNLNENKWNSVLLTPKEHFICHILLWKHYRYINDKNATIKMSMALRKMNNNNTYNSKVYEKLKLNLKHTQLTKDKMSNSFKGRIFSQEHKENLSKANKGNSRGSLSQEHKDKISQAGMDRIVSKATRKKLSDLKKGIKFSEEHKKKLSESALNRKPMSQETKDKMSKTRKQNNYKIKTIRIYDNNNNLLYTCNTTFKPFCEKHNIPFNPLVRSYQKKCKVFESEFAKTKARNVGLETFIGWYAIKD